MREKTIMSDPQVQAKYRQRTLMAAGLTLIALWLGMAAPPFTKLAQLDTSMLTVHLLMELFAIIIAMLIVVVSWHTFDTRQARSANILICGFMVVAACDIAHALTYEGMPSFLAPSSTPRAIFFWLMGRTFEVLTLAVVAIQWTPPFSRRFCALAGLAVSGFLIWLGSYHIDTFPVTFIKGQGVTPFKAIYEYVLCALNVLVALLFWVRAQISALARDYLMALSSFVMGAGEIMFTAYVAPSDFQNIYGHAFKLIAYALLYWATFVTSVRAPFEDVRSSENRLRESEERIRSLSNNLPKTVVYQVLQERDGTMRFLHISESAEKLYGVSSKDIIRDSSQLYRLVVPEDIEKLVVAKNISAQNLTPIEQSLRFRLGDGVLRWIHISSAPRRLADGHLIWDGVLTDITEAKLAEEEIARLGLYDGLTGLPNRRLLMDRLGQALTSSSRSSCCGALLFLDLDNFKDFNDTLGHDKGDELLKQVAARLMGNVRGHDTVSRFGGDEFVVMLVDLSSNIDEAASEARTVAEKFLASLRVPFSLSGQQRFITMSIGISLFGDKPTSIDEMMKSADLAMYRAKATGRNALRFFDPEMQVTASERASLEADLHHAIESGQFVLYYQPQIEDRRITGAEALVRWMHPDKGMIPPVRFIDLAEQTGMIVPLGKWVLETVCHQLRLWAQNPATEMLTVSVNVSAREFRQPEFSTQVIEILERSGVDPHKLKIELTESVLVEDVESIITKMMTLQVRGVRFSLDDFGTGYSSLTYLKRLPLSLLKIDQSFVRDILVDSNDAAIARTVIALGKSLGLAVIAEGVETEGQRDFLLQHGCNAFQGYLFCRPLPIDQFEQYLLRCIETKIVIDVPRP